MTPAGKIFVVSAPSGGGKGTILRHIIEHDDNICHAVSATTRLPRKDEIDGQHYYFLSGQEFDRRIAADEFVEWAEVHGQRYGTLKSELDRLLASGQDVLLELDVQGMQSIQNQRDDVVTIFIFPPSLEILEERLRGRGDLDETTLQLRLHNAQGEIAVKNEYNHQIRNDRLDSAIAEFDAILREERAK